MNPVDRRTNRLPVPKAGFQRRRGTAAVSPSPLTWLRYTSFSHLIDECHHAPEMIDELPLPDLVRLLPQQLVDRLHMLFHRRCTSPDETSFPYVLEEIVRDESLLSAFCNKLANTKNLADLVTNPPAILLDEYQRLFFYRGVPVTLRPISFSYLLLLAKTPERYVRRETIYDHLWPGEVNYQGSDKPYERQISDHKRKLIDEIKRGIAGKIEIAAAEMESLITTRLKVGYMLNVARENVLMLEKKDIMLIVFAVTLKWSDYFPDFILEVPELFILC